MKLVCVNVEQQWMELSHRIWITSIETLPIEFVNLVNEKCSRIEQKQSKINLKLRNNLLVLEQLLPC